MFPNQNIKPVVVQQTGAVQSIHSSIQPIQLQPPGQQPVQVHAQPTVQTAGVQPVQVHGQPTVITANQIRVTVPQTQSQVTNITTVPNPAGGELERLRRENEELKKRIEELEKYTDPQEYDFDDFYENPFKKQLKKQQIEENIKPETRKKEYDRSTFTIERLNENFADTAVEMVFAKDNYQPEEKVDIIFDDSKEGSITKFNLDETLNKYPRAGIFVYLEKTLLMFRGSKKASEMNEDNILEDDEFKIHVLMYDGEYKDNWYLKPVDNRSFVCKNELSIIEIPLVLSIEKTGLVKFEEDFLNDINDPELFENVGEIKNLIRNQNKQTRKKATRFVVMNWE